MEFIRFTPKNIVINGLIILLYLTWSIFFVGLRSDQFLLISIYLLAFYATPKTRKFVLAFSIFIVYWIIYDSMRVFPNYLVNTVHIQQPYEIEKGLFGIFHQGILVTPNEFFASTHSVFLDLLTGIFYLNWVPLPLMFAFYFFATGKKELFLGFSLVFFITNIIGFIGYYLYPAAPPWYFAEHGNQFIADTMGSRAGFAHFDQLVGIDIFKNIYDKNANVFAAVPSLHSSYPVILLYYASKMKKPWVKIGLSVFTLGIWFSAIYSGHHYIIDVMLGLCCAILGIIAYTYLCKIPRVKKWMSRFAAAI